MSYTRDCQYEEEFVTATRPPAGGTRACPDCGRPQHYTGIELGWCHDALVDTWHCADPRGTIAQ